MDFTTVEGSPALKPSGPVDGHSPPSSVRMRSPPFSKSTTNQSTPDHFWYLPPFEGGDHRSKWPTFQCITAGTINGAPEIFVGSPGFANIREGDRIEVRGSGSSNNVIRADRVTLLGRRVAAPQTGVGQTRTPASISTPTAGGTTPSTAPDRIGRVDGVVRQVNATEGRLVVETDRHEILTVRTVASTPVVYQGNTYRVSNLEVGDRIRVEPENGTIAGGAEVRAHSITVTTSAQEANGTPSREVGGLSGRVMRVERSTDQVRVDS